MKQDFRAAQENREINLSLKADELRAALRALDPSLVASRSGSKHLKTDSAREELHLEFFHTPRILSLPEWVCPTLSTFQQTLLLYYLITAEGTPLTGKWVSFADLPDGRMYNAAFQGCTGNEIVKHFGNALEEFRRVCLSLSGVPAEVGDASFTFQALPRVPLLVTYWLGDEDFPASCKILFDSSASHYLPIDASAMLGNILSQKIIKSAAP